MFETLPEQPADKILQLMQMFRDDTRDGKIDLGVGVYKNAQGVTPIMRSIKAAQKRVWDEESSMAYTGLAGTPAFNDAMIALVLGDAVARGSVASVATPGGTGAVRLGFELARLANAGVTVWHSQPTWPNHPAILRYLSLPVKTYRYLDASGGVDVDGMLADLDQAASGDLVLLHGCCHNPTGANLGAEDWSAVIAKLNERGLVPMIDIAYQGFGDGLDADAAAVRAVAAGCPVTIIAASCSKNFRRLQRTCRHPHGDCAGRRDPRPAAKQSGRAQPPDLFVPARSRRKAGHDGANRRRLARRLAGRA